MKEGALQIPKMMLKGDFGPLVQKLQSSEIDGFSKNLSGSKGS